MRGINRVTGSGRVQAVRIMPALAVLTKNGIASPEAIQEIVKRYLTQPRLEAEKVISDLCELDIPEEKTDVFAGVCNSIRALL